jgi:hypothetical protein
MGAPRVAEFVLNQTKPVLRGFLFGGILPAVAVQNRATMQGGNVRSRGDLGAVWVDLKPSAQTPLGYAARPSLCTRR